MAHKRVLTPAAFASGDDLTSDMVGIGMRFAASSPPKEPNIENTLVAASIEGILKEDYRVLSLLVDWLDIHIERVNVDRLTQLVMLSEEQRVRAFWVAIAQWKKRDWRLKRLQKLHSGARVDLVAGGAEFQIERYGEDERFAGTALRVPAKLLRHRPTDVLTAAELSQKHLAYYYRVMIGPSYRADMWALIERTPSMTSAEIARQSYGSFPTAWEVRRDWLILQSSSGKLATVS
jgi:uncharacterized protein (DUF2384 family)